MLKKHLIKLTIIILIIGGISMLVSLGREKVNATLYFGDNNMSSKERLTHILNVGCKESDFDIDSSQFSQNLANISISLSASAADPSIAFDNLKEMSFENSVKFSYDKDYKGDVVGLIISSKRMSDCTLIAIIIRGTVGREWYSNFDTGYSSTHKGFEHSSEFVYEKLKLYITKYSLENEKLKFLVTGHSRGGAVANLLSKQLIDLYGSQNVYAYTFASPNTTTIHEDDKYQNIFNIVNSQDIIAYLPLESWGYTKYGTTIEISPTDDEESENNVQSVFKDITGNDYTQFDDDTAVDNCLEELYNLSNNVDEYYTKKYPVGGTELTTYEYFKIVADLLSGDNTVNIGVLKNTMDSDFSGVSQFFSSGIDMLNFVFTRQIKSSSIIDAHCVDGYVALINAYSTENAVK